jgi:hypothetical protein
MGWTNCTREFNKQDTIRTIFLKEKIVGRPKETAGVRKQLNWMDVAVRKVCSPIATQANHFPFNCNCA